MVNDWAVCSRITNTLVSSTSYGVIPLEVLICDDVNMTGVDFVKEIKAAFLRPRFQCSTLSISSTHPGVLFVWSP